MIKIGVRVVRGPDWKWASQDGGEGHLGTLVGLGVRGDSRVPEGCGLVAWDHDGTGLYMYRIGHGNAFDLRVYDSAPLGSLHPGVKCANCHVDPIPGARWKCVACDDYDLCSLCYHGDKHNLGHAFLRLETPSSKVTKLPPRKDCSKVQAQGIFPGAVVTRGRDWKHGDQDGGDGKRGKVVDIRPWNDEFARSAVRVRWENKHENTYRLGFQGKTDVLAVTPTSGGHYYKYHLPIVALEPLQRSFSVDEYVRVDSDLETVRAMQPNHGEWMDKMRYVLGRIGKVVRQFDTGDVKVLVDGEEWTLNPVVLDSMMPTTTTSRQGAKAEASSGGGIKSGDSVRVIGDVSKLKELQKGHGGFNDNMRKVLGCVVTVIGIDKDGDVHVKHGDQQWCLNPQAVEKVDGSEASGGAGEDGDGAEMLRRLLASALLKAFVDK